MFNLGDYVWVKPYGYRGRVVQQSNVHGFLVEHETMFDGPDWEWVNAHRLVSDAEGQAWFEKQMAEHEEWRKRLFAPNKGEE